MLTDQNSPPSDFTDGRLKLRHLKLVVAIAEEGTMAAAADRLDVSQPVVSRSLQEVEGIVGLQLFVRGRGGVTPTPAGVHFLRHAQGILTELKLASRDLNAVAQGKVGRVVVGTGMAGIDPLLPLAVDSFHAESPEVVVSIHEAPPGELLAALLHGSVDLVIGRSVPHHLSDQLRVKPLYIERLVPAVSIEHELAKTQGLKLEDLTKHRWVVPDERTAARIDFAQAFSNLGLRLPPMRVECSSILTATELVKYSNYISPLPEMLVLRDSRLCMLDFELANMDLPLCLIYRAFGQTSSLTKRFEKHLESVRDTLNLRPN